MVVSALMVGMNSDAIAHDPGRDAKQSPTSICSERSTGIGDGLLALKLANVAVVVYPLGKLAVLSTTYGFLSLIALFVRGFPFDEVLKTPAAF